MLITLWALGLFENESGAPPTESIEISANDATVSVYRGSSVDITVTLSRIGGYSGNVTLAVAGLPTGTTASYVTNNTFTGSESQKVVRLTAAGGASVVTNDAFTITATGSGVSDDVINGTVTVSDAPEPATGGLAAFIRWFLRRRRR